MSSSHVLSPPTALRSRRRGRPCTKSHLPVDEIPQSPCELSPFRNRTNICDEENKENEDTVIGSSSSTCSLTLKIRRTAVPSNDLPNIVSAFQMPSSIINKKNLHESFDTQETVSVSESEDEISSHSSSFDDGESSSEDSAYSCHSKRSIRFADEVGLPIQNVRHYECDRRRQEHSELLVLCLFPERKKFEFLHVGYYHCEEKKGVTVQALLSELPGMCTDSIFSSSEFVTLYRSNPVDNAFVNICASPQSTSENETSTEEFSSQTLTDCAFRENELLVASVRGSSERAVLEGIGSLLSNDTILKTLKRARRSRRSLKFVYSEDDRRYRTLRSLKTRKRRANKDAKKSDVQLPIVEPKNEVHHREQTAATTQIDCTDLVDEYCHDYDPFCDESDFYLQLLVAIITISLGTVVFSAMGI
ncbi:unnamed protein product [Pseudo-nitzschia multistriata]|uniref:Uncharacterized protein n=1 Tax=Pseudo-nitzschia multistriata TaxID=183589 RepID=A0A448ZIN6_9STRA|nr:unnamed protein product [Pseudo-nitzschia multistriata]